MTKQEKIKYLSGYKKLDSEIIGLVQELSQWHSKAGFLTSQYSGKGTANRLAKSVEHILAIEDKINDKIDELVNLRSAIMQAVDALEDSTLRQLLNLRYIQGRLWEQIQDDMHYTNVWIWELHNRALKKLDIKSCRFEPGGKIQTDELYLHGSSGSEFVLPIEK